MGNYNFVKDLKEAKITEERVAELLKNGFEQSSQGEEATVEISTGKNNKWDFVVTPPPVRYELKNDKMAHSTGNVAIEYECRGKPSGIAVTQSDRYLYLIDKGGDKGIDILVELKVEDIVDELQYLNDNPTTAKTLGVRKVTGGDFGSKTKMWLIPLSLFLEWGEVIAKLPNDNSTDAAA